MDFSTTQCTLSRNFYRIPTVQVLSPQVYLSKSQYIGAISMARAIIVSWKEGVCSAIWIIRKLMMSLSFAQVATYSKDETSMNRS
jgi:hypothetical protein